MSITFQGNPLTLVGSKVKVGDIFPDFTALDNNLNPVNFGDTKGVRVFLGVPSLDTPVCDLEIKTFNKRASEIPGVTIYTVSMDLPFAQARWCGAAGISNVVTLSDYKDREFAIHTGSFIEELALVTRDAFVVNSNNKVTYVEYLSEITDAPDYDKILEAAAKAE